MAIQSLRALAKAHSEQRIDRKQYIHGRRKLIDDIISGAAEIIPYEAPIATPDLAFDNSDDESEPTLEIEFEEIEISAPSDATARWSLIAVAVALWCVAAVLLWIIFSTRADRVDAGVDAASTPNPPGYSELQDRQ